MRNELHHIEQIEKYLNDEMSITEVNAFEQSLKNNPSLAEQVETQQLLMQAAVRKAIKADIAKFGTGGTTGFNWLKWIGISTGIIIIIAISYFTFFNEDFPEENKDMSTRKVENSHMPNHNEAVMNTAITDTTNQSPVVNSLSNSSKSVLSSSDSKKKTYNYAEDTECGGLKTWVEPDRQITKITPSEGATIEGKEGTLIIVPTDAFVDEGGNVITEVVDLELVEALKVSDMIAYNLTTMNDDNVLQSGGMIYLQPTVNGKEAYINPERPLYVEIPTDDYNPDMKVWDGEINENGDINWKNPKELEKFLTIVDFELLDFLPTGFEETVQAGMPFKNHKTSDKTLVDSLYYSIYCNTSEPIINDKVNQSNCNTYDQENQFDGSWFGKLPNVFFATTILFQNGSPIPNAECTLRIGNEIIASVNSDNNGLVVFEGVPAGSYQLKICDSEYVTYVNNVNLMKNSEGNQIYINDVVSTPSVISQPNWKTKNPSKNQEPDIKTYKLSDSDNLQVLASNDSGEKSGCFILPQSIQTIKSDKFSKTFLSTKEFEARLKILHQMPNAQELFDLYVTNLGKELWEVDELVASKLDGSNKKFFIDFAAQKLTNIKDVNIYQKQLTAYYNKKKKENYDAAKKANEIYQEKTTAQLNQYLNDINQLKTNYNNLVQQENELIKASTSISSSSSPNTSAKSQKGISLPKINLPLPKKNIPKNNVAVSKNAYTTKWYSGGWKNIDAYLKELGNGEKTVTIEVNKEDGKVYQCLNTLKTIVPLTISGLIAKAKFPKWGKPAATKMTNTYAIGIRREGNQLQFAQVFYNPYETSKLSLNWKDINSTQLMKKLEVLDGTKTLIYDIKKQEEYIKKQIEIKQKQKEIKVKKEAIQEEIKNTESKIKDIQSKLAEERAFIASLEAVINKCGVTLPIISEVQSEIIEVPEVMPEFPGGMEEMYAFLSQNIIYPPELVNASVQGKVYVRFIVDENGSIIQPMVLKGVHPALDAEALRVVSLMPAWTPGIDKGITVKTQYTIPINFVID